LPKRRATTGQGQTPEALRCLVLSGERIPLQVKLSKTDKIAAPGPETTMLRQDIKIGGFYTKNGTFAREVIGNDGGNIIYRDYQLSNGSPISHRSECGDYSFARWARRECTPEEKTRCDTAAMQQLEEEHYDNFKAITEMPIRRFVFDLLDLIETRYLVDYLERKGYKVEAPAEPTPQ
jgi:hypothetical protein